MSIVSTKKIRLDVPEDLAGKPGQWIDVIKLSGRKQAHARLVKTEEGMHSFSQMDAAFVKAMQEGDEEEQANLRKGMKALEFDITQFDVGVLLFKSIRGWSFEERPTDDPYDQLDPATSYWLAEQIIELMKPPTKADLKNLPSGTTSP